MHSRIVLFGSHAVCEQNAIFFEETATVPFWKPASPSMVCISSVLPIPTGPVMMATDPVSILKFKDWRMGFELCWSEMLTSISTTAEDERGVSSSLTDTLLSETLGLSKYAWIRSKLDMDAAIRGKIVMTMLIGCVIIDRIAVVVNAVLVSNSFPLAEEMIA